MSKLSQVKNLLTSNVAINALKNPRFDEKLIKRVMARNKGSFIQANKPAVKAFNDKIAKIGRW